MNPEVSMTLDEAVAEVLGLLTGLDLEYIPELDKYQSVTRQLNAAMRAVALEQEWGYYASEEVAGNAQAGLTELTLRSSVRPRITGDDSVRLVDPESKAVALWAYYQPRASLPKYRNQNGLWCSSIRNKVLFSRPLTLAEERLQIIVPIMREPRMFRLPQQSNNQGEPIEQVPAEVREQLVDFDYPDLVIRKAAYLYAQSNPLWQPRVQTLEANYKEMMYALTERDLRNTDAPYMNDWSLGIENSINGASPHSGRPSSDSYAHPWQY